VAGDETPLAGGRVTPGVVRIGDTVRRPISTDHSLQHMLLLHLERCGFAGAPRFLGIDELGREILSYLSGEVPGDLDHFDDAQLSAAAMLLRRFHDATADFAPVRQRDAEVMCHNDWGPPNAVFRDGLPYGIIDFDAVAPGLRLWDLGYSAWTWLDIGNPDYASGEQLRRLAIFAAAYDLPSCSVDSIVAFVLTRQTTLAALAKSRGETEIAMWANSAAEWTVANITDRLMPLPPGPNRK
jgi:Ser/Thr protein kinase RdoA (MazF antagonist)